MGKIYINELATALMRKHGLTRHDAQQFVSALVEIIQQGVADDRMVKVKGLGTFKIVDVGARESVNVNTGERVTIDSHSKLSFVPDNTMKELVNRPFSQFETVILNDGVTFEDENENVEPLTSDTEDIAEETEPQESEIEQEPIIESETEPAIEPKPEPVVESEPEPEPELEPESKLEPTPLLTPIQETEETEVPQEEEIIPEPPVVEVPLEEELEVDVLLDEDAVEDEPTKEEPTEEEPTEEETIETPHKTRWWLWLLLAILACVLCFAGGFFLGKNSTTPATPQPAKAPTATATPASAATEATAEPITEAATQEEADESVNEQEPQQPATEQEPQQPAAEPAQLSEEEEWAKYEAMDARVRTGAYNIMGLDRVVVVRQGENTKRIARRTLGEGMECYIEVYNGINASTPLQPGMEIKIPKVKMKASAIRRLRQSNNQ